MMSTAPQDGDRRVLPGLDQRDHLGDHLVLELLALFVDHDELGDEHPGLAGPVHDLVVEVMDGPASLAGDLDGPDPQGLEGEVQDPDALLVAGQERRVDHPEAEVRPVVSDRDGRQGRDEVHLGDLGRAGQFSRGRGGAWFGSTAASALAPQEPRPSGRWRASPGPWAHPGPWLIEAGRDTPDRQHHGQERQEGSLHEDGHETVSPGLGEPTDSVRGCVG